MGLVRFQSAQSPDLSPLDWWLWGALKDAMKQVPTGDTVALSGEISRTYAELRAKNPTLPWLLDTFTTKLRKVIAASGDTSEL